MTRRPRGKIDDRQRLRVIPSGRRDDASGGHDRPLPDAEAQQLGEARFNK